MLHGPTHSVFMSSRFTKKSFVRLSGFLANTPMLGNPTLVLRTRMPPIRTVISGAVSVSSCARLRRFSGAGRSSFLPRKLRNPSVLGSRCEAVRSRSGRTSLEQLAGKSLDIPSLPTRVPRQSQRSYFLVNSFIVSALRLNRRE